MSQSHVDYEPPWPRFAVASSVTVIYDWVLTFGQEIELVWRQRWSYMTFLYLGVRYIGIPYAVINMLLSLPTVSVTDAGCNIMFSVLNWSALVVNAILGVIITIRLHVMYQQSKVILIFLVVMFMVVTIASALITGIVNVNTLGEELILSGTYLCSYDFQGDAQFLVSKTWIFAIVWEVVALCLAVWIAAQHYREQRSSTGSIVGDCFTVLIRSHVLYFGSFFAVSCGHLTLFSVANSSSVGTPGNLFYAGVLGGFGLAQMFVLGPRLILSIREFNAKLVAEPGDTGTEMATIFFQEHGRVSTDSYV